MRRTLVVIAFVAITSLTSPISAADDDIRPCDVTPYGCCSDGITTATSKDKEGCPAVELCQMPPAGGLCTESLVRWFYNSQSGACEEFLYSGCGGNGNRFKTLEECRDICRHGNMTNDAVAVDKGSDVTLTCEIPEGARYLDWKLHLPGKSLDLDNGDVDNIRVDLEDSASYLTITDMQTKDSGKYVCRVLEVASGLVATTELLLVVSDKESDAGAPEEMTPPLPEGTTDDTPLTQAVPAGMDLNLTCEVPAGGEYLSWQLIQDDQIWPLDLGSKKNMRVIKSDGVSVLEISDIETNQAGLFVCQIIDLATGDTYKTQLDIEVVGGTEGTTTDFPFVTEIDPTPSLGLVTDSVDEETATTPPIITRTVPAGEDLDLTCEIPDGTEFLSWSLVQSDSVIPLIEGALDNMAVKESAGESVLAIKNIQTDQSGTYVCEIKEMESDLIASTQIELIVEDDMTTAASDDAETTAASDETTMGIADLFKTDAAPEEPTTTAGGWWNLFKTESPEPEETTMVPKISTSMKTSVKIPDATITKKPDMGDFTTITLPLLSEGTTFGIGDLFKTDPEPETTVVPDITTKDSDESETNGTTLGVGNLFKTDPQVDESTTQSDEGTTMGIDDLFKTKPSLETSIKSDGTTMGIGDLFKTDPKDDVPTTMSVEGTTLGIGDLFKTDSSDKDEPATTLQVSTTDKTESLFDDETTTLSDGSTMGIVDLFKTTLQGSTDSTMELVGPVETETPIPVIETTTSDEMEGNNDTKMSKTTPGHTIYDPVDGTTADNNSTMKSTESQPVTYVTDSPAPLVDNTGTTQDASMKTTTMDDMSSSETTLTTSSDMRVTSDIPSIPTTDQSDLTTTQITDMPETPVLPALTTDIPDIPTTDGSPETTTNNPFKTDESMGKETITPVPQEKSTMEDTDTTETPVVPPITDEIIFVRGCAGSKYGCCSDKYTYSQGPNFEGCPETRTGYSLPYYPRDFVASKLDETTGDVRLSLSWSPPQDDSVVDLYVIHHTTDLDLPLDKWETEQSFQPYTMKVVDKDKPTFFKVRAYNREEKSPITPTFMYNDEQGVDSIQLLGGCYGTRHGCCDDGLTSAYGPNREGCPEQVVVTRTLTLPILTTTPKPRYTTTTEKVEKEIMGNKYGPPVSFKILRDAVAADRVAISLNWDDPSEDYPVDDYVIRFSNDARIPPESWRRFTVSDSQWQMALRRVGVYYFTIAGEFDGKESRQSPVYSYSTEDMMSKVYEDEGCSSTTYGCCDDEFTPASGPDYQGCPKIEIVGGCAGTRWGCCSDGKNSANGPDKLGCESDPQPCDASQYGCCPDGESSARGDNFVGCADTITKSAGKENPICLEHKDKDLCTNYTIKWYYEPQFQACTRFWYGGCNNNKNKFDSEAECLSLCENGGNIADVKVEEEDLGLDKPTCYQPSIVGPCKGLFRRWTFSQKTKQCEEFVYGGCQGNENRFNTPEECEETCNLKIETQDICDQPKDSGPCFASIPSMYYDRMSMSCRQFMYGGCGGNENRFNSPLECEKRCKPDTEPEDICMLPADTGMCRARIPQYAYNSETMRCERFIYGGCGGNANRFNDEGSCQIKCGEQTTDPDDKEQIDGGDKDMKRPCDLPKVSGPCRGYFIRWYYDSEKMSCDRFVYGGCQGNANNFETEEECESEMCDEGTTPGFDLTTQALPQCSQPSDSGPCYAFFEKWFYNPGLGKCEVFVYGGCSGNDNRFDDKKECEQTCGDDNDNQKEDKTGKLTAEICSLDRASGSCDGYDIKWYFDSEREICRRFVYTGCDGNENRFDDWDTCKMACESEETDKPFIPRTTPRPTTTRPKVSTTPEKTEIRADCERVECSQGYKCVLKRQECVEFQPNCKPIREECVLAVKPGECPRNDQYYTESCSRLVRCRDDTDCAGSRKCCDTESCSEVCIEPEPERADRLTTASINKLSSSTITAPTGSPPSLCSESEFGCCKDEITPAADSEESNCPDDVRTTTTMRPTADQGEALPSILNTDDTDYEVALGEDVTLKCETSGNPQPTIVWYKDRKPIYVGGSRYKMSGSGDLTIRQVKSADSAEYICRAFNNGGSDYLYTDLVVKSHVNILAEDTDIEVELDGTAVLTCEADGTPPPRTNWEFQGFPVSGQRAGDSSLYLYNIRPEDIGDYTCTADNGISTDRKTVTLTLREPMEASLANHNKTYTSGDDMTLTCDTTSDAEITWSKDGRVISSTSKIFISGSSLTVTDLLESDTGYYTCRADDGTDVITVGTSILVEAPVTKPPVPASCGDRPDLANCALIVRYNYCGHPVYKHFCCKSCLEAGKFNSSNRPFRH